MKPLRVAINAQLLPGGGAGGVEQFVTGLVHALGRLHDGPEHYTIIGPWQEPEWLEPYLGPNQALVRGPRAPRQSHRETAKRLLGPLRRPMGRMWRRGTRPLSGYSPALLPANLRSHGFYESLDVDLVHFPYQHFVHTSLPAIYNPHDLQHLHYPQFFTSAQIAWREIVYPTACRYAHAIAAESQWVKSDLTRQYGVPADKIYVIRRGSPTELYEQVTPELIEKLRQALELPETFAFYPAHIWPHKNHIRLLEALKLLRDRHDLIVNLVCTGHQNDFWATIENRIADLGLQEQVRFLGFVSATELRALYRFAQFVVIPSLFEGGGFPVVEAFREGAPVACSSVTALPEYGGDAVLLFDPTSVEAIARAVLRMAKDADLRAALRQRGSERSRLFPWTGVAKAYRALYRNVAGQPLSDEERDLLARDSRPSPPPRGSESSGRNPPALGSVPGP